MKNIIIVLVIVCCALPCKIYAQPGKPKGNDPFSKQIDKANQKIKKDIENSKKPPLPPIPGSENKENNGSKGGLQNPVIPENRGQALSSIESNIDFVIKKNKETHDKIIEAFDKLDKKLKEGKIQENDYKLKKKALEDIENALKELEEKNDELRDKLDDER